MKYYIALVALILSSLVFADDDSSKIFKNICSINNKTVCQITSVKRTPLANKLAHYEMVVSIGNQPFNKIGLHRIVKEKHPGHPYKSKHATMFIHGDVFGFSSFITSINSQVVSQEHSIAIQMAKAGIDVWGIDLRWTKIPVEISNFDFMKEWGLEQDLRDLDVATTLARNFRKLKGNYDTKLNLLGWSRGGQLGYLYLAKEASKNFSKRNIKAFIPVDTLLKTDDEFARQSSCQYSQVLLNQFNSGKYADETGLITQSITQLSQYLPDEQSPILEGLTNKQTLLLFLTSTYLVDPTSYTAWYHYNAGQFNLTTGMPIDLAFTDLQYMYEFTGGISPYMPTKFLYEAQDLTCEQYDSTLDDRLNEISVPIFYVYSAGGFGRTGLYTANLTASRDISELGVTTLPAEFAAADFGHIDLFTAYNANELVWQPIIHWIKTH
jgi:pimeloyl-ACP methyl ester carboxylesterase